MEGSPNYYVFNTVYQLFFTAIYFLVFVFMDDWPRFSFTGYTMQEQCTLYLYVHFRGDMFRKLINSICTISNNSYVTNNLYHILKIEDEVIRTNIRQTWQLPMHMRETDVPGAKLVYELI